MGDDLRPPSRPHPDAMPFQQGDLVDGEVTALARKHGARGVAAGVEVRVPGGVPGDRGQLRITHVGRNAIHARIHDLKTPSPDRVEAPCDVVARCGGCPWQMVSLDAQRAARTGLLEEALAGFADGAHRHQWPGAPVTTGYRTRALMMARHRAGHLRLGFYATGTSDLVPAEGCVVQHPALNEALGAVHRALEASEIPTWRGPDRPGVLRAISLRIDPAVGTGLLTLVVSRDHPELAVLAEELLAASPAVTGVFANINGAAGGPVLGPDTRHLAGETRQLVTIPKSDVRLEVGPTAFLQTHHAMGGELVRIVDALLPDRAAHLLDAYSGVGMLGLALRHRARRVTLVESNPEAVADARHNVARLEAGRKVEVIAASVAEGLAELHSPPDAAILDPPRAGCGPEVIGQLVATETLTRIVHVSCGLPGLARDVRALVDGGFEVTDIVPLDMFVHTPHAEVVVALRRKAGP